MDDTQNKTQDLRKENLHWQYKFESLKKFALENKIPIPPELDD